ncbi:hypothetical protein BJV82DRAFT_57993 [Fennellomyces sp. T-0311]|nr:hypothetical protein BJV82DRAFT_57993 [Fennellomyces sp. T-0311]
MLCKDTQCTKDVTHMATLLPSSMPSDRHAAYYGKAFLYVHLDNQHMGGYNTVGVWQHGGDAQAFVMAEMTRRASPLVINQSIWKLIRGVSFPLATTMHATVEFPTIRTPLLTYRLTLQSDKWRQDGFAPMVQQNIGGESKYHVGLNPLSPSVDINFYAVADHLQLQFWKPHDLQAHLKIDWYGSIGKCVLRYGPSILNYMFVMALVALVNGMPSVPLLFFYGSR